MIHVYLWDIDLESSLIIVPTRVTYAAQIDGVACVQRELEGVVVPLPKLSARVFTPDWWYKNYNRRTRGDRSQQMRIRFLMWAYRSCGWGWLRLSRAA